MPLTVLHLLPDLAVGGGQVIVRNQIGAAPHGERHIVVSLRGGPLESSFRSTGVAFHVLDVHRRRDLPAACGRLARLARQLEVDVLHVSNTPVERLMAQVVGATLRRPVVNSFMAIATSHQPRRAGEPWRAFAARRLGNIANRVSARTNIAAMTALSDVSRQSHAQALGLPASRIDVVFPGVPDGDPPTPSEMEARRRELDLGGAFPVLICIGRVEPNKGQRDLLPAVLHLSERHPKLRLLVAGEGEDREPLSAAFAAKGVGRHVSFLGRRDDVPALCALSDIVVSTASHEGFGMAVLEAMAARCAVVSYVTDAVAVGEFVDDGVHGRLVAPDPDALAAAIDDLASDEPRLRACAEAAHERATMLSAARAAGVMDGIYRRVTARQAQDDGT